MSVFDVVATNRLPVTGMHLHYPGFAHLVREGTGYRLIPEEWGHALLERPHLILMPVAAMTLPQRSISLLT